MDEWQQQKGVHKEKNRRENDTTVFQTHSETWRWDCPASSGVGYLYRTDSTLAKERHHSILPRRVLHSLVGIYAEKNSYCRRIMSPNAPQSFDTTTWRPKKSEKSWLSWLSLHSHLTSTPWDIYRGTWRLRNPSILWHHKRLCGTPSIHVGITRVSRFYTDLWSPYQLKWMLSLWQKGITHPIVCYSEIYRHFSNNRLFTKTILTFGSHCN